MIVDGSDFRKQGRMSARQWCGELGKRANGQAGVFVAQAELARLACSKPPPGRARWTLKLLCREGP